MDNFFVLHLTYTFCFIDYTRFTRTTYSMIIKIQRVYDATDIEVIANKVYRRLNSVKRKYILKRKLIRFLIKFFKKASLNIAKKRFFILS